MERVDLNILWQNFIDTISNHYTDFGGRVGRAQYWYYILTYAVIGFAVAFVSQAMFVGGGLSALYGIALLLPTVGLTARRLQDTGRPGTWAWLLAVPIGFWALVVLFTIITVLTLGLGAILYILVPFLWLASVGAIVVLIIFCAQPGEAGTNAYGPAPGPWPQTNSPSVKP